MTEDSAASEKPTGDPAYPEALAIAETAYLRLRRAAAGDDVSLSHTTGVALSGGGIRSAIFALGVFQALAAKDLLRRIDYLSTVSGGSYFGAFFGALFAREHNHAEVRELLRAGRAPFATPASDATQKAPAQPATPVTPATPAAEQPRIEPVAWLRQNGRYLAPRGGTDAFRIFAITLRNWLALAAVVLSALLTVCVALQVLTALVSWPLGWPGDGSYKTPAPFLSSGGFWRWSASKIGLVLPLAWSATCGIGYWCVEAFSVDKMVRRHWRTWLSDWLSLGLQCSLWVLVWVLVDSLVLSLRELTDLDAFKAATSAGAAGTLVVALRKLLTFPPVSRAVSGLWTSARVPMRLVLWPIAIAIWGSVLAGADALALTAIEALHRVSSSEWAVFALLAVLLLVQCLLARASYFLNRSSQHAFYAERLMRTFIGASNPSRYPQFNPGTATGNAYVSEPIDGDDVEFGRYHAEAVRHGGPLHLINVTLNETVSPYAATVLRDRKGMPMAIGPCGISAGVYHHALDAASVGEARSTTRWTLQPETLAIAGKSFRLFGTAKFEAERLNLGYWTAISGAAVATGLGSYGGTAVSLLVGFANLRLGYWWQAATTGCQASGTASPSDDDKPMAAGKPPGAFASYIGSTMQSYLFAEFAGRFYGPHRKHWYLSDGGHSENTGALELIRRRVTEIVIIDAEGHPDAPTGNLGDLVRKARQDYQAEIVFDDEADDGPPFGPYRGLIPGAEGHGSACAVRGRVRYLNAAGDEPRESRLLYIRPVLFEEDAPDLLRYLKDNPDFPYQSTADQFFDEAQWESYRRLGERIGLSVFR